MSRYVKYLGYNTHQYFSNILQETQELPTTDSYFSLMCTKFEKNGKFLAKWLMVLLLQECSKRLIVTIITGVSAQA